MTTAHADQHPKSRRQCRDWRDQEGRGVWNPVNIGLMILGFIFFTPLGLIILFGLIMGISPFQLPRKIASWFNEASEWTNTMSSRTAGPRRKSGNDVFDEYQQTQLDRIEEIRSEVKDRDTQFKTFRQEEQRGKDKKQFDRFMGRNAELDE